VRDLTARLRAIVRQDAGRRPPDTAARELTYVPDAGTGADLSSALAARALGGTVIEHGTGTCVAIDRVWDATQWHGRRQVSAYHAQFTSEAPLRMFDARIDAVPDWADRVVFFDTETTGLSGGAGTLAFLVGCGWFADGGFHVRQFFLSSPAGEPAMLADLARIFADASLLVTYNGRTFDVPLMESRWAFHRRACPTDDLPHFDMLPPARRLWSARDPFDRSCSLTALERAVLGFHRWNDVPGLEMPARYFRFLRTADASVIDGVLDHNRHDLLSLAALTAHALWLVQEGPLACREPAELVGLGRLYERAGDGDRALEAYDLAARTGERSVRRAALTRLALLLRRRDRFDDAAAAWRDVIELCDGHDAGLERLARQAVEALAIHHEHRARDLTQARRYAERLRARSAGRAAQEAAHRLQRIDRKLQTNKKAPAASTPLLSTAGL
jgi:uncharacterized protein YprB with RNaseH-like and TPR domain